MGATKGSILELGMTPILTSGLVLQFLASAGRLDVIMISKGDRELFQSLQKVMAMVIAFVYGALCVLSGMYGPVSELGIPVCILIVVQMVAA